MTVATLTKIYEDNLPGFNFGYITAANDYTSTFGFSTVEWVFVVSKNDDDAIISADISLGTATLGVISDSGAAITSATPVEIFFMAKGSK